MKHSIPAVLLVSILGGFTCALASPLSAQGEPPADAQAFRPNERPDWDNIAVFRVHKEPPRATCIAYPDRASARVALDLSAPLLSSPWSRSLDGNWKFHWSPTPAGCPADFHKPGFDVSAWKETAVPGCWEPQGYGQIWYTNDQPGFRYDSAGKTRPPYQEENLPALAKDPCIPHDNNPTGAYRREFELPADWAQKEVFVRFGGVLSAFTLWINGSEVGFSEDSYTPAEFDITKYVKPGKNLITVKVYRWSIGTFMELQDTLQVSGIFRSVHLLARPKVSIRDFQAAARLAPDLRSATLEVRTAVANRSGQMARGYRVKGELVAADGTTVPVTGLTASVPKVAATGEVSVQLTGDVPEVALWSPDQPNLYELLLTLQDASGQTLEVLRSDFGFRQFESKNRNLYLNSQRFYIKGVNAHEAEAENVRALRYAYILEDARLMKQHNINFVRTSHYPHDERWYYLCNRFGIAVLDENNYETHGFREFIPDGDPAWIPPAVDRMRNMVHRDKNQPSVLIWSLGNEFGSYHQYNGFGPTAQAMADAARAIDPTRGIHCETPTGAAGHDRIEAPVDFVSPMYGELTRMQWYLTKLTQETRPFFFCEYAHALGNSVGFLDQIWEMIRANDGLNGGFIWEWVGHTVKIPSKEHPGRWFYARGNDLGAPVSAGNFNQKVLITPNRKATPALAEVAHVYQDVQITPGDLSNPSRLAVWVKNEMVGTNAAALDARYEITEDGVPVQGGQFPPVSAPPSAKVEAVLPPLAVAPKPGREYFLTVRFATRQDGPWAPMGHPVASCQFPLPLAGDVAPSPQAGPGQPGGNLVVTRSADTITVKSSSGTFAFDAQTGALSGIRRGDREFLKAPLRFDVHSAWIDNHVRNVAKEFTAIGLDRLQRTQSGCELLEETPGCVRLKAQETWATPAGKGFRQTAVYTVLADERLRCDLRVAKQDLPEKQFLPRLGVALDLDPSLRQCEYLGRGPQENYADRCSGAEVGRYRMVVPEVYDAPYMTVQDCDNHEEVRWVALTAKDGGGLLFRAQPVFSFSALPWNVAQLKSTPHPCDLPDSSITALRLAWKVAGLGNNSCGSETLEEHRVFFSGEAAWSFEMRFVDAGSDLGEVGRAR